MNFKSKTRRNLNENASNITFLIILAGLITTAIYISKVPIPETITVELLPEIPAYDNVTQLPPLTMPEVVFSTSITEVAEPLPEITFEDTLPEILPPLTEVELPPLQG